jgi:hypothetical protein
LCHVLQGLGLVFVAVYQKALSLLYVEELLQRIKEAFASQYEPDCYKYPSFETTFQRILKDCEAKADAARRQPPPQQTGQQQAAPRGQQLANGKQHGRGAGGKGQHSSEEEDSEDGGLAGAAASAAAGAWRSSDTAGSSEDETTTATALVSSCVSVQQALLLVRVCAFASQSLQAYLLLLRSCGPCGNWSTHLHTWWNPPLLLLQLGVLLKPAAADSDTGPCAAGV